LALSDSEEGCGKFEGPCGRRKVPIGHSLPNAIRQDRLERHEGLVDERAHLRILRRELERTID
jgi:hypothetical protein